MTVKSIWFDSVSIFYSLWYKCIFIKLSLHRNSCSNAYNPQSIPNSSCIEPKQNLSLIHN